MAKQLNKKQQNLILCAVLAAVTVTLTSLLIGYTADWLIIALYSAVVVISALLIVGIFKNVEWLTKLMMTCYYVGIIVILLYGAIAWTGVTKQFYNAEGVLDAKVIADVIAAQKGSKFIFVLLSFLQVTFVPIPSTVTTVAGFILFGQSVGFILSLVGQMLGSMTAFWLGRVFGAKLIIWIVGKDAYEKYLAIIKGRDKIVLLFMLLFPFFPDDLLCMFAGLTSFTGLAFFIILLFSRSITIGYTTLLAGLLESVKNLGVWSYAIYALVAAFVIGVLVFIWKKGDLLEKKMLGFIDKITPAKFKKAFISDIDRKNVLNQDVFEPSSQPDSQEEIKKSAE